MNDYIDSITFDKVQKAVNKANKKFEATEKVKLQSGEGELREGESFTYEDIQKQIDSLKPQLRIIDGRPYMVNAEGEVAPLNRSARRALESQRRRGKLVKSENTFEVENDGTRDV